MRLVWGYGALLPTNRRQDPVDCALLLGVTVAAGWDGDAVVDTPLHIVLIPAQLGISSPQVCSKEGGEAVSGPLSHDAWVTWRASEPCPRLGAGH